MRANVLEQAVLDESGFVRIYHAHYDRLVRQFRREFPQQLLDVEDCVQEVFSRLWTRVLENSAEIADPVAWLFRAVNNALIDKARAHSRRRTVSYDDATPPTNDSRRDYTLVYPSRGAPV